MSLAFRTELTRTNEEEETPRCQQTSAEGALGEGHVAPTGAVFSTEGDGPYVGLEDLT